MSLLRYGCARRALHCSRVALTSADAFSYATVGDLAQKIQNLGAQPKETEVVSALAACRRLLVEIHGHDKFSSGQKVTKSLEALLSSENVAFSPALLKKALLLNFPTDAAIKIIQLFYKRNPKTAIEKDTALVPFRKCLYDAEFKSALKITDLTTGHPNYVQDKHMKLRAGVLRFGATAVGVTLFSKFGVNELVEWGLLRPAWTHLSSLNAMILTYLFNLSFFVTIVKFGRQLSLAGGDFLTWQKGTFYTHWYKHADEMAMCTRILEADSKLHGLQPSEWLVEELCRTSDRDESGTLTPGLTRTGEKVRLLAPKDNLEELKLQAYWMSGGDGFEWVEPDQDPAEILWHRHLHARQHQALGDKSERALKWADELIPE